MQPVRGYHVSRFAWAQSHGLITAAEFAVVTAAAGSVAPATVIWASVRRVPVGGRRP
jgi:hypothetical protein